MHISLISAAVLAGISIVPFRLRTNLLPLAPFAIFLAFVPSKSPPEDSKLRLQMEKCGSTQAVGHAQVSGQAGNSPRSRGIKATPLSGFSQRGVMTNGHSCSQSNE